MKELRIPFIFAVFCFFLSFLFSLFSDIGFFALWIQAIMFSLIGFVFSLFLIKFLLYFVPDFEDVLVVLFNSENKDSDSTEDRDGYAYNESTNYDTKNDTKAEHTVNASKSSSTKKYDHYGKENSDVTQTKVDIQENDEDLEQKKLDEGISTQNKEFEYNNSSDNFDETRTEIMLEGIKREAIEDKEKIAKTISHFLKK